MDHSDPFWLGKLHTVLSDAGVKLIGLSPSAPHATDSHATFMRFDKQFFRVDWATAPADDQVALALSILGKNCNPPCEGVVVDPNKS